jgi:uncharacterized protein (DUF433 family)
MAYGPVILLDRVTLWHMDPQTRRQHLTFRLPSETLARLDSRARSIRESRTGLAERYLEEGLRMDEHPGIGFVDGPVGRRAILSGTGLDVWEVIGSIKQAGGSVQSAARYLELDLAVVRAAVRYYAAYPAEVDDLLARQAEAAAREEAAAQRERAILG